MPDVSISIGILAQRFIGVLSILAAGVSVVFAEAGFERPIPSWAYIAWLVWAVLHTLWLLWDSPCHRETTIRKWTLPVLIIMSGGMLLTYSWGLTLLYVTIASLALVSGGSLRRRASRAE